MLRPRRRSGSYSASTDLPVVFKAPTSKGSEGGRGPVRRRRTEKRGEGQEEGKGRMCGTNVRLVATRLVELLLMGRSLDNADG